MEWRQLAERVIAGARLSREEGRAVLDAPREEDLAILDAAYRVRRAFHGDRLRLHVLRNAMSGVCPEDCHFCSQSSISGAPVKKYTLQSKEELVRGAVAAKELHAWKYCIVTATRGPSEKDLDRICDAVREIKRTVDIKVCTSLGILERDQAVRLKEAGVDRFNHNLETSARLFPSICTTHTYEDRVRTIHHVKDVGMQACCGGILGMGETHDDVLDLAFTLADLGVDSVPVNFLDPRPGTPLSGARPPSPRECLRYLCLFRLLLPRQDLRAAGGREANLRSLAPLALLAVNSVFSGGYLTTPGAAPSEDARMIADLGLEVEEVIPE